MTKPQPVFKAPFVDVTTLMVILAMAVGFPILVWSTHLAVMPLWGAVIIGSILMNLSFTAWHECSHRNFSRVRIFNDIAGVLAAVASTYPGYYARRREHLVHHRWEGIPGKDPVYYRIQTGFWRFPLEVLLVNWGPNKRTIDTPDSFHPIKPWMKVVDLLSNLFGLVLIGVSIYLGFWIALLAAWVIPRVIVFVLHAYYICYFPHHIDEGGYQVFRVRQLGFWIRFITVEQSFHGLHHKWPYIPWHQYSAVIKEYADDLDAHDIQVLPPSATPGV